MSDKIGISNIVLYVLLVISAVVSILFYSKSSQVSAELTFPEQIDLFGSVLEYFIYWTYTLLAIGAILAVGFGLYNAFSTTKAMIRSFVSILIVVVVVGIAYLIAKAETTEILNLPGYTGADNTIGSIVFASTSIYTMYFLMIGAFFAAVGTEVAKMFR